MSLPKIDGFDDDDFDFSPVREDLPEGHRSGYVAVVGRPNVGKSTLMNHFLGQKIAIVSHKPQTTRNQLLGILTLPDEAQPALSAQCPPAQVVFVDTPGIHQPHHKLGEFLVETAVSAIPDADVVLWLVDASQPPSDEDQLVAQAIVNAQGNANAVGEPSIPVLLALNKSDLLQADHRLAAIQTPFLAMYSATDWLALSATQGYNRDALLRKVINLLPLGPRYFPEDQVTDQQTRFIVAELIRETALKMLHEEVPHSLAVLVTEFKQRHQNLTYISADLILERKSQKGIVIGEKGQTLKNIGRRARPQIEDVVGTKVYLDLWVKIRPKWRKKDQELRWLGYTKSGP